MFKTISPVQYSLVTLAAVLATGCPPPAEQTAHDHAHNGHSHAESYTDAIEQIQAHAAVIRTTFTEGDPEEGHDALHEIGHLLEGLVELAEKAGLGESDQADIGQAAENAFKAYADLDKTMHSDEAKTTYADIAETVDGALETLVAKVASIGVDRHALDDDHEHGDEGGGHDDDAEHDEGHDEHPGHDEDGPDQ